MSFKSVTICTTHTTQKKLHSAHTVRCCVLYNSYNKQRQFPRQHEHVGITVGTQCVFCEVEREVRPKTGNEGPDGSRGIALLLL